MFLSALALLFCMAGCGVQTAAQELQSQTAAAPAATPILLETVPVLPEAGVTRMPTDTPEPSATPVPTPFSVIWMTDTQALSYHVPEALTAMGAWIAAERESRSIAAVFHTGDIVDNGHKEWEWENFDLALLQFEAAVPFIPLAGNHDIGVKLQKYDAYLARPFLARFPEEQCFAGGRIVYELLTAGGTEFIVVAVGWKATDEADAVEWVNEALETYRDRTAILLFHACINGEGNYLPGCEAEQTKITAVNPNVRLVLCGHSKGEAIRMQCYDDDGDGVPERSVPVLMYNYLTGTNYGMMRILQFDPADGSVSVRAYSPYLGRWHTDAETGETAVFVLEDVF